VFWLLAFFPGGTISALFLSMRGFRNWCPSCPEQFFGLDFQGGPFHRPLRASVYDGPEKGSILALVLFPPEDVGSSRTLEEVPYPCDRSWWGGFFPQEGIFFLRLCVPFLNVGTPGFSLVSSVVW